MSQIVQRILAQIESTDIGWELLLQASTELEGVWHSKLLVVRVVAIKIGHKAVSEHLKVSHQKAYTYKRGVA